MRIPSNHVYAVIAFFHSELSEHYDKSEIDQFVAWCFAEFLGFTRSELHSRRNETMNESDLLRFHFAVKALRLGRPIQYIFGKAAFFGMEFMVNENVLIPRPETEELVEWIISDHAQGTETFSLIDIGTGSGCIAVSVKKKIPRAQVYALDVSVGALALARENAQLLQCDIHLLQMDILDKSSTGLLPSCSVIVSNPPYIRRSEAASMASNVRDYEPHQALFVPDDDALVFYNAIASCGLAKLKSGGHLYFEINEAFGIECCIALQKAGYTDVTLRQDLSGKDRMIRATKP